MTVQGLVWQRIKWGRIAASVLHLGERAAVRLPSATRVVSRTLEKYYLQQYGTRTMYVPNGAVLRQRQSLRHLAAWGLEPDHYILYLGRFSPEKNCHLLISAYEQLETTV